MIKIVILIGIVALAWIFLAEPAMMAGRRVSKYFKEVWNNDENTDL